MCPVRTKDSVYPPPLYEIKEVSHTGFFAPNRIKELPNSIRAKLEVSVDFDQMRAHTRVTPSPSVPEPA